MKPYVAQKPLDNNPYAERACPGWFEDAKVGIFIHWGPYSVPGWAITGVDSMLEVLGKEMLAHGYDVDSVNQIGAITPALLLKSLLKLRLGTWKSLVRGFKYNCYAEWYWNSLRSGGPTAKHHKKVWGDKTYPEFGADFNEASSAWDASGWSDLFSEIGAKYVITTAKHHDGFCLWPTSYPCPNLPAWHAERDLLGELKQALEPKDIRFALYYSAGFDWTFTDDPVSFKLSKSLVNTPQAIEYFDNHLHELIDRYQPDLIWQDIAYPRDGDFNAILAHYYDAVPHGVMNDRGQPTLGKMTRHFDYTTTEYFVPQSIRKIPWETCRGISASFGYNQSDDETTSLRANDLIVSLSDIVSKNGNLLLGLGPKADGTIPEYQTRIVKAFGHWLQRNGEAIYKTRPHVTHRSTTNRGHEIRYTTKNNTLYAIVLGQVKENFKINNLNLRPNTKLRLLENNTTIPIKNGEITINTQVHPSACCFAINQSDII